MTFFMFFIAAAQRSMVSSGKPEDNNLFWAITYNDLTKAEAALKNGANPDAVEVMEGQPVLLSAIGYTPMLELLLKYKANIENVGWGDETALHYAVIYCHSEGVKILLNAGAQKTFLNASDNPPLIQVIGRSYKPNNCPVLTCIKNIAALGADINYQTTDGNTALMEAARVNDVEATKFLLKNGATKHLKNKEGKTALDLANDSKSRSVIAVLK